MLFEMDHHEKHFSNTHDDFCGYSFVAEGSGWNNTLVLIEIIDLSPQIDFWLGFLNLQMFLIIFKILCIQQHNKHTAFPMTYTQ